MFVWLACVGLWFVKFLAVCRIGLLGCFVFDFFEGVVCFGVCFSWHFCFVILPSLLCLFDLVACFYYYYLFNFLLLVGLFCF